MREPFDLPELQALPLPRATPENFTFNGVPPKEGATYVGAFLPPRVVKGSITCVGCGGNLYEPGVFGAIISTFEWGLANGEGHCSRCGYPTRMYHRFEGRGTATFPLQYHPDELEERR